MLSINDNNNSINRMDRKLSKSIMLSKIKINDNELIMVMNNNPRWYIFGIISEDIYYTSINYHYDNHA